MRLKLKVAIGRYQPQVADSPENPALMRSMGCAHDGDKSMTGSDCLQRRPQAVYRPGMAGDVAARCSRQQVTGGSLLHCHRRPPTWAALVTAGFERRTAVRLAGSQLILRSTGAGRLVGTSDAAYSISGSAKTGNWPEINDWLSVARKPVPWPLRSRQFISGIEYLILYPGFHRIC
jgi:hypothetical protein